MDHSKYLSAEYPQVKRRRKTRDIAADNEHREPPNPRGGSDKQLAIARLAASYKGECKKLFKELHFRQDGWLRSIGKNGQIPPGILPAAAITSKPPLPPSAKPTAVSPASVAPAATPQSTDAQATVSVPTAIVPSGSMHAQAAHINPTASPHVNAAQSLVNPTQGLVNPIAQALTNPLTQALANPVAQALANLGLPPHLNPAAIAHLTAAAQPQVSLALSAHSPVAGQIPANVSGALPMSAVMQPPTSSILLPQPVTQMSGIVPPQAAPTASPPTASVAPPLTVSQPSSSGLPPYITPVMVPHVPHPWKQSERDALKRAVLSFGVGRWVKLHMCMLGEKACGNMTHSMQEVEVATYEFLEELCKWVDEADADMLKPLVKPLSERQPPATQGGQWSKVETAAKLYVKRIKMLDDFNHMMCRLAEPSVMSVFQQTLHSMPDSNPPATWWTSEADLALLYGVYKLGYGNYESIKDDPEFAHVFVAAYKGRAPGQTGAADEMATVPLDDWPATDVLTRRFKRLCDHLMRAGRSVLPHHGVRRKKDEEQASLQLWSKKERVEFVKWIMAWGPPPALVEQKPEGATGSTALNDQPADLVARWAYLKSHPLLSKKTPESLERVYKELMGEMEEVTGSSGKSGPRKAKHPDGCPCAVCANRRKGMMKKRAGAGEEAAAEEDGEDTDEEDDEGQGAAEAGGNKGGEEGEQKDEKEEAAADGEPDGKKKQRRPRGSINRVLTNLTAARLKERLEVLQVLKQGVEKLKPSWNVQLVLVKRVALLPTWWRPNHDSDLVTGVLKYGFGSWQEIMNDPTLSFKASALLHASDSAQRSGDPGGGEGKTPNSHGAKLEGADKEDEAEEDDDEKEDDKDDSSTASDAEMVEGRKERLLEHWMPESRALGKRCRMISNVMKRMLRKSKYLKTHERSGGRGGRGGRGACAGRGEGGGSGRGTRIKLDQANNNNKQQELQEEIKVELPEEDMAANPSPSEQALPFALPFPLSNPSQLKAAQEEQERLFQLYANARAQALIPSQSRHRGSTPDPVSRKPSTPSYLTPIPITTSPLGVQQPDTLFATQRLSHDQAAGVKKPASDDTESVTKSADWSDRGEEVEKGGQAREQRHVSSLQLEISAMPSGSVSAAHQQQIRVKAEEEEQARRPRIKSEHLGYERAGVRNDEHTGRQRDYGSQVGHGASPSKGRHDYLDGFGADTLQGKSYARSAPGGFQGDVSRKRQRTAEDGPALRGAHDHVRAGVPYASHSPLMDPEELEEGGVSAGGTRHDASAARGRSMEVREGAKGTGKQPSSSTVTPLALEIAMSVLGEIGAKDEANPRKGRRGRARSHPQGALGSAEEPESGLPAKRRRTVPAKFKDEEGYTTQVTARRQPKSSSHTQQALRADDAEPPVAATHAGAESPASADTEDDIPIARKTVSLNAAAGGASATGRKSGGRKHPSAHHAGMGRSKASHGDAGDVGVGVKREDKDDNDGGFDEDCDGVKRGVQGRKQHRGGKGGLHPAEDGAERGEARDAGMVQVAMKQRRTTSADDLFMPLVSKRPGSQAAMSYQNIPRDQYGRPVLPLQVNSHLNLICLGRVEYELPGFYSSRAIFPVGFKTRRRSSSLMHRDGITSYTSEILEKDGRPAFRVAPDDAPQMEFIHSDPTTPWMMVFEAVHARRGLQQINTNINGAELFGLTDPLVARLIQELPGAELGTHDRTFAGPQPAGNKPAHGDSPLGKSKHTTAEHQQPLADPGKEWQDTLKQQGNTQHGWAQQEAAGMHASEMQQLTVSGQKVGTHAGMSEALGYEEDAPPTPPKFKSSTEVPLSRMLHQHRQHASVDSDLLVDVKDDRWGDAQGQLWGAKLLDTAGGSKSPLSTTHGVSAQGAQPASQDKHGLADQLPEFIQSGREVGVLSSWQQEQVQGGQLSAGLSWELEGSTMRQQDAASLGRKGRKLDLSGEQAGRPGGQGGGEVGMPEWVERQRDPAPAAPVANAWSLNHVSSVNVPTVSTALASRQPPRPMMYGDMVGGRAGAGGYELELAAQMFAYNRGGVLGYDRGLQQAAEALPQARPPNALGLGPASVQGDLLLRPDTSGAFPSVFTGLYAPQPSLSPTAGGRVMLPGERQGQYPPGTGAPAAGNNAAVDALKAGQGLQLNVGGYGTPGLGLELPGSYGQGRGEPSWENAD